MNSSHLIQYLANILYVIYADKHVEKVEEQLLNTIAQAIGGHYHHIDEAVKRFQEANFELSFPFAFSDAIRNVEDILRLSLADEAFKPEEKAALQTAISLLGLTRGQFERIYREVKEGL